jgi:glycosyltransferase involved in cell wall biosynthesis
MDAVAVRRFKRADIQMARAERIAGRQAGLVLAYSERVGHGLAKPAHIIPIAYPVPEVALAPVSEPIAALMADWSWPPNQLAASWLLSLWPEVRDEVPGARLLLAGRNLNIISVGYLPGVELVGEVRESADLLGQAAVMAFPCPTSSGPKVKVLEALAHGLPVVTTSAGMEGLVVPSGDGAVISDRRNFARALTGLLADPERRASLGDSGRAAVARHHSPLAAARARIKAFEDGFGTGSRAE